MSEWDGKFSNLKISPLSNRELFQELAPLEYKGRAERLRFLATLGLMQLQKAEAVPAHTTAQQSDDVDIRRSLNEKLMRQFTEE